MLKQLAGIARPRGGVFFRAFTKQAMRPVHRVKLSNRSCPQQKFRALPFCKCGSHFALSASHPRALAERRDSETVWEAGVNHLGVVAVVPAGGPVVVLSVGVFEVDPQVL